MPSTLSLIRNIFTDPNRRRLAIAVWAAGFSGGAALGPIFGGWLVEHFWWGGAVFLVAAFLLLPLLAFGRVLIPESKDANPGRVDVPSILLSVVTMAPFVYGIKEFAVHGFGASAAAFMGVRRGDGHYLRPPPAADREPHAGRLIVQEQGVQYRNRGERPVPLLHDGLHLLLRPAPATC